MLRSHRWRTTGWAVAGGVLLLPLVAMQFTDEVNWTVKDFVAMGLLLGATGLMLELVFRHVQHPRYRLVAGAGVLGAFLLVWGLLATG